jgi:hypothetical protein
MSKSPKDHLTEAKRIAARMLATPPEPHDEMKQGRKAQSSAKKASAPKLKKKPGKSAGRS